ncbi:RtcB family protein [Anaerocolumna xylanovorans]|uniref:3'-phosphate/5'-hydroxy nucleic acid ligase n=1 Tax=Anaerocolumna xylanovorans DSM 12503 TaxID=1121345 RepID=A0A1M7Y954_9FIRM|nr:RtcB family protein [Anaerocolumna xylanovorans]SHO49163.1 tRNA-splicing ligase RtcB [Anaerocolumna xylanovorans DSM 12503]
MFVIADKNTCIPIKVWLEDGKSIDESCLEQAYNLSRLPFLHQWVALMPDTHTGMGMPIGGVIAAKDVIIPNAVGVDIGCGMAFAGTNIPVEEIKNIQTGSGTLIQAIVGDILRNVPTGFKHHTHEQPCNTLDRALEELYKYEENGELLGQLDAGFFQIGTLGGGNHFIELQEDEEGYLGIMIHSGSRNFGKQVCDAFHHKARELNQKWHSQVPDEYRLAFLPVDIKEGRQYINWMNLALDFAEENRLRMMLAVKAIVDKWVSKYTGLSIEYTTEINCHHNYASLEQHYGKEVWVHRKGATRAREGELAVIPGAMGSYSYVVEGLGNDMSFHSSSHGAGRRYSRKGAMAAFTTEEVMGDLQKQDVVLGKFNKKDVAEESRFAYKDIDEVMENQRDLVKPVKRLKTIGVVKG